MRNKVLLLSVLLLLLSVGGALATEVDCGWGFDGWVCSETELQPVVDELDEDISSAQHTANKALWKAKKAKSMALDGSLYVSENEAVWSIDKKGVSFSRVKDYLLGDYWNSITSFFVSKLEYNMKIMELENRLVTLEKMVEYMGLGYTDVYEKGGLVFGTSPSGEIVRLY